MQCTSVLFFAVYNESDPRLCTPLRSDVLTGFRSEPVSFPLSLISHPCSLISSIPSRINTYKSATKQTTSTIFRINTYEKHRGEGGSNVPAFYKLSLLFSHSSELFCVPQKCNSFRFKRFRTLSQKHPGWGYPHFSVHDRDP
jgi:hypothetical protein